MTNITLTIPEALQLILFLEPLQEEEDPLAYISQTVEEALNAVGVDIDAIATTEQNDKLEDTMLEHLLEQIEAAGDDETPEGSISFQLRDRELDALVAMV